MELELKEETRFLEIILDRKLSWQPNITIDLYACNKVLGKKWGLRPRMTHWIYTAVIRPILTYG